MNLMRKVRLARPGILLLAVLSSSGQPHSGRPLGGAIRWDAWHGKLGEPGRAVERSLGAEKWRTRLPFFARILSPSCVSIDGSSPQVMDREIRYAVQAGLNYWAFVTYDEGDPMSLGLKNYLNNPHKRGLRFCLISEEERWGGPDTWRMHAQRLTTLMRNPAYLRVLDRRPLLFLGFISDETTRLRWGGIQAFREAVDGLRGMARDSGSGDPYIVIMDPVALRAGMLRRQLGADAISAYAVQCGHEHAPYAELAACARRFWDQCAATQSEVVPIVMSGWDRRPRVEKPVPWEPWQKPGEGLENYYRTPTPDELARHLEDALRWTVRHPHAAAARTVLIYAWNEIDEGGWLLPTLGEGALRVKALHRLLKPAR